MAYLIKMALNEPVLKHEDKYVVIEDVNVNLIEGIALRQTSFLVKEMEKYSNRIIFSKENKETSGHISILEILSLGACPDSKLKIKVENIPGTNPEDIAKRLYAGITTKEIYPNFNRDIKEDKIDLEDKGDYFELNVKVNLSDGINMNSAGRLFMELLNYENKFELDNSRHKTSKGKESILEILSLGTRKGDNLKIRIEKISEKSLGYVAPEYIAERIYAGLSSKERVPDFDGRID